MNPLLHKIGYVVGAFVFAFTFAGCSDAASDDVAVSKQQRFPLDEYLSVIDGTDLSFEEQNRQWEDRQARETELITQCMHDAGFEYDPDNLPGMRSTAFSGIVDRSLLRWNDRDWVAQWGYGITNSPLEGNFRLSPGGRSSFFSDGLDELPEHDLSEAEQAAFSRALNGPPCEEWGVVESLGHGATSCAAPRDWTLRQLNEVSGCRGQAWIQFNDESPEGLRQSDEFLGLFDAINQLRAELRNEITDADRDWATCMADAGFPNFERQIDAENNIWGRRDTFWRPSLPPTQLNELAEREIDTALADFDCRVGVDYEARRNAHRTELETQFVTDHRQALEALRDAAEQRS